MTFSDPAERGRAFGVYGAVAGAGGAVGLLLGGVLTEYLSWRRERFLCSSRGVCLSEGR